MVLQLDTAETRVRRSCILSATQMAAPGRTSASPWVALSYFANDEAALIARCHRLTAEVNDWLSGRRGRDPVFDGAVGSLFRFYQIEPNSPYHRLEPASRHPYYVYARMIVETVGNRRIDALDGRDGARHAPQTKGASRRSERRSAAGTVRPCRPAAANSFISSSSFGLTISSRAAGNGGAYSFRRSTLTTLAG